jgi:hypothetical protein
LLWISLPKGNQFPDLVNYYRDKIIAQFITTSVQWMWTSNQDLLTIAGWRGRFFLGVDKSSRKKRLHILGSLLMKNSYSLDFRKKLCFHFAEPKLTVAKNFYGAKFYLTASVPLRKLSELLPKTLYTGFWYKLSLIHDKLDISIIDLIQQ